MMNSRLHREQSRGAFSLIELLVVMAIMGILLFLAVPASLALQQSGNLNLGGQAVADEIAVAREMAPAPTGALRSASSFRRRGRR